MSEVFNASAIHNNGESEVIVGIRRKQFKISYDKEAGQIVFTDPINGQLLTINGANIDFFNAEERMYPAKNEAEVYAKPYIPYHNGDIFYVEGNGKTDFYALIDDTLLGHTNAKDAFKKFTVYDTYTKQEIDAMLDGVMKYGGAFDSFQTLLAAVNAGSLKASTGTVAYIVTEGGYDCTNTKIVAHSHLMYNGTGWELLN